MKNKMWIFALKIVFWLYMLKKGSYGLLNIIFENSIFGHQIEFWVWKSIKIFFNSKMKKIRNVALKIVFWSYILNKGLYGILTFIFEKSIFRDQIHILGSKMNKHIFFNFWLKYEEKIWIFALKIVRTSKHHFWKVHFWWPNPHFSCKNEQTYFFITFESKMKKKSGFLHWKSFFKALYA